MDNLRINYPNLVNVKEEYRLFGENSDDGSIWTSDRNSAESNDIGRSKAMDNKPKRRNGASRKICSVCGDSASGYNFGVVSCESCKAFFRRHGMRPAPFQCPFKEDCVITIQSRKHCQKCRLKKCFQVGMKLELVMIKERRAPVHRAPQQQQKQYITDKPEKTEICSASNTIAPTRSSVTATATTPAGQRQLGVTAQPGNEANPSRCASTAATPFTSTPPASTPQARPVTKVAPNIMYEALRRAISTAVEEEDVVVTFKLPTNALLDHVINNGNKETTLLNLIGQVAPAAPSGLQKEGNGAIHDRNMDQTETALPLENGKVNHSDPWSLIDQPNVMGIKRNLDRVDGIEDSILSKQSTADMLCSYLLSQSQGDSNVAELNGSTCLQLPELSPDIVGVELWSLKLEELLTANDVWAYAAIASDKVSWKGYSAVDFTRDDYCQLIRYIFTNTMKQHGRLSALKKLPSNDQVLLIKEQAKELVVIRGATRYNAERNETDLKYLGDAFIRSDASKRVKSGVHNEIARLRETFPAKFRFNETLTLILTAIALFNPDFEGVTSKQAVAKERDEYIQLLNQYMISTYGAAEAYSASKELLNWISNVNRVLKKLGSGMIFDINPRTYEMMMFEILDFDFVIGAFCTGLL